MRRVVDVNKVGVVGVVGVGGGGGVAGQAQRTGQQFGHDRMVDDERAETGKLLGEALDFEAAARLQDQVVGRRRRRRRRRHAQRQREAARLRRRLAHQERAHRLLFQDLERNLPAKETTESFIF